MSAVSFGFNRGVNARQPHLTISWRHHHLTACYFISFRSISKRAWRLRRLLSICVNASCTGWEECFVDLEKSLLIVDK